MIKINPRSYEKEKYYENPYPDVFKATLQALEDNDFNVETYNRESGIIHASVGTSFWSWGENIELRVISHANGTKVYFYSGAHQAYDWGKTEENAKKFFHSLNHRLHTNR